MFVARLLAPRIRSRRVGQAKRAHDIRR